MAVTFTSRVNLMYENTLLEPMVCESLLYFIMRFISLVKHGKHK